MDDAAAPTDDDDDDDPWWSPILIFLRVALKPPANQHPDIPIPRIGLRECLQ